jgi:hypothetical protein
MTFNKDNWTLKRANILQENLQQLLINMTADGGSINKYATEAQNYELTFGMPLPELVMAVENLVNDLKCNARVNPTATTPYIVG